MPEALLPESLKTGNPWRINRLVDGKIALAQRA
jgi:NADP-dependent aldehyde dehydrogenase